MNDSKLARPEHVSRLPPRLHLLWRGAIFMKGSHSSPQEEHHQEAVELTQSVTATLLLSVDSGATLGCFSLCAARGWWRPS